MSTAVNPDILNFIPQRPPFVMIDDISTTDDNLSYFTIREGHLFVQNGIFTEPGLVENMAQTAAVSTGYKARQEGKPAPVGYIGALKNLSVNELPKVGDTIRTEITFLNQILGALIVQGRIYVAEREIASCELRIFIQATT